MSFFKRLFSGGKKDTVQKPPPEPTRRPPNPPKSAEAQRIRWVNEDVTSQPTLPGQPEPSPRAPASYGPVAGAGAAQGPPRLPNGMNEEVNPPRSEPQSAYGRQSGSSGPVSGLNKPRSAPVSRNTQVPASGGFRPQSATVTKMVCSCVPARFLSCVLQVRLSMHLLTLCTILCCSPTNNITNLCSVMVFIHHPKDCNCFYLCILMTHNQAIVRRNLAYGFETFGRTSCLLPSFL